MFNYIFIKKNFLYKNEDCGWVYLMHFEKKTIYCEGSHDASSGKNYIVFRSWCREPKITLPQILCKHNVFIHTQKTFFESSSKMEKMNLGVRVIIP